MNQEDVHIELQLERIRLKYPFIDTSALENNDERSILILCVSSVEDCGEARKNFPR